jgi:hypothetical protein
MNISAIPPLVSSILFITLGLFVFFKNPKSRTNQTFGLMCLVTFWWQFSWFILFSFNTAKLARIMVHVGYTGIIFIPYTFYHFFIVFLKKDKEKYIVFYTYLLGSIFLFFNWTSDWFIKGYYLYSWGYYPKANFLHLLYLLSLSCIAIRIPYLLYKELLEAKSSPFRCNQIKYILFAFIIYTLASFDFAVNYGLAIYPIGFVFISFSLGIMAYTIIKYRLMDITIFAIRSLIFGVVYALVLGIPFGAIIWLKPFIGRLGYYGMLFPVILGMCLSSAGPFIYLFLQRHAEEALLRHQRRYQSALRELSKTMTRIRDLNKLMQGKKGTVLFLG